MQKRVVISQSMYFPWVGMLEQMRLADVFVHYDDVQFSKGSFANRVQIKTPQGIRWMTVPLKECHLGQRIDEVKVAPVSQWRGQHLDLLKSSFEGAPYASDALQLVEEVYAGNYPHLGALARASLRALTGYFGLVGKMNFVDSKSLGIGGASSQRLHDIVFAVQGNIYITGHGARNYLDHQLFEQSGIAVQYMQYRCIPYPQLHGDFTPYVTALDLVANCGQDGVRVIQSEAINWKEFMRVNNEQS